MYSLLLLIFSGVDSVDFSLIPNETYQKKWLRIYLKKLKKNVEASEEEVQSLYSAVEKFSLASHFLWGVWSLLQAEHSFIDFDFINYASLKLTEYYKAKKRIFSC